MNTTEPAAGVWRDARTQEICKEDWDVEMLIQTVFEGYTTAQWDGKHEHWILPDGTFIIMEDIKRYARINT